MTNEITQGRIAARMDRMDNPRAPRMGKIKLGYQVKNCWPCKNAGRKLHEYKIRAFEKVCPNCGGTDFSHSYPDKTNYFVFYDDGNPSAGQMIYEKAIALDFTWKSMPIDCVEIAYVCYQGGKLFCKNRFDPDPRTGEYNNRGIAIRQGREIECNPLICPLRAGGNFTLNGKSRTIDPQRPQCGEKVTMHLWLPRCPGFDAYMFQSGSINTINNIQDAVKTYTRIMMGNYMPLKLKFKLKKMQTTYPDQGGKPIKTEFYSPQIEFPFSVVDIQERLSRGEITPGDIMYRLPDGLARTALPGPSDDHYDDLVDGPRELPAPKPEMTVIADLQGVESPLPAQVRELDKTILDSINEASNILMKGMSQVDKKKLKGRLKKTHGLDSMTDIKSVDDEKGHRILHWLNLEIDRMNAGGVDDYDPAKEGE